MYPEKPAEKFILGAGRFRSPRPCIVLRTRRVTWPKLSQTYGNGIGHMHISRHKPSLCGSGAAFAIRRALGRR